MAHLEYTLYTVGTGVALAATTPPTVGAGQAPFGITFYVANQ